MENKSFGLAHYVCEGAPMHPDELDVSETVSPERYKEWYDMQLKAYNEYFNIKE